MKVLLYGRVSTKEQEIIQQRDYLRTYCKQKNYEIIGEYFDKGISGTVFERPELNKLFKSLENNKIDAVVIYKLDRFGRSARDLLNGVEKLKEKKVGFISVSDSIDTTTHYGKLIFTVLAGFAEFERNLMLERTKLGLARAQKYGTKSGKPMHRPRKEIDMEKLKDLYVNKKLSQSDCARMFNVSRSTIINRLKGGGLI